MGEERNNNDDDFNNSLSREFFLNYRLHELVTGQRFGRKKLEILNNLYENNYWEKVNVNFQSKVKLTFDVLIPKQSNLYISTVAKKKTLAKSWYWYVLHSIWAIDN